ncbi:hypothetical protein FW774_14545 [Pedobacter sp. BS3]|nr:hypothetical protein FW774_14545 [Pedobacter sp. BS3]
MEAFLTGKSDYTVALYHHFTAACKQLGEVSIRPTKSMIAIAARIRFAYINQLGKNFINVVIPFTEPHPDNLCFHKIAQVPGDDKQFNHHLRLYSPDDLNEEVLRFLKMAYIRAL